MSISSTLKRIWFVIGDHFYAVNWIIQFISCNFSFEINRCMCWCVCSRNFENLLKFRRSRRGSKFVCFAYRRYQNLCFLGFFFSLSSNDGFSIIFHGQLYAFFARNFVRRSKFIIVWNFWSIWIVLSHVDVVAKSRN